MKTIIAGSRGGFNYEDLCSAMEACGFADNITEVVSGTARGVDLLGEKWAHEHGLPVKRFPANWDKHGKSAGYIRNKEMAEYADAVVILWDGNSKGTKNMIDISKEMNHHYVHIIQFFDAPVPPSMSTYSNAACYRAAMDMYKIWEKMITDQGIRLK